MPNYNPDTGIAYGVISGNTLDPDVLQELMFGGQARNLSYEATVADAKAEAETEWRQLVDLVQDEADSRSFDSPDYREDWVINQITLAAGDRDHDDFIDAKVDEFTDGYEGDEDVCEGVLDGVIYRGSWLGGTNISLITHSPHHLFADHCSHLLPCSVALDY